MVLTPTERGSYEPRDRRTRAILAAVAPTARVAHLGASVATVAVASVPMLVAVARGDGELSTPSIVLSLVCGATLGWAADDPPADLLGAMPVPSPLRAALRVASVSAVVVAVGAVSVALAVWIGPGLPPDAGLRASEAGAAAAMALAGGFVAARLGESTAGPVGVTVGALGVAVVAAFAVRWPDTLPGFTPSPVHDRWWIIAALGVAVLARAGRDPARP